MISIEAAHHDAEVAADEAAVRIVPASTPDELDQLRRTMEGIWGPEIVPPRNLLRGMAISGNCLLVAWRNSDPVGFALGWLGWGGGIHFHSHQVGVMAGERGGGVGYALKLAQRALCLDRGVAEMRWTFDPMLLSNARFNLGRLGAVIVDFLPHCYGDRRDAFNTGDTTDRVEVSWRLDHAVGGSLVVPGADDRVIEVPTAYHALRNTDRAAADEARRRVGESLNSLFAAGGSVAGLCDTGYVVRKGR